MDDRLVRKRRGRAPAQVPCNAGSLPLGEREPRRALLCVSAGVHILCKLVLSSCALCASRLMLLRFNAMLKPILQTEPPPLKAGSQAYVLS